MFKTDTYEHIQNIVLLAYLATSGTGSCAPVPVMRSLENAESNEISS